MIRRLRSVTPALALVACGTSVAGRNGSGGAGGEPATTTGPGPQTTASSTASTGGGGGGGGAASAGGMGGTGGTDQGVTLWTKRFGGIGVDAAAATVDPSGDIVVTGIFANSIDFGGGVHNAAGFIDAFVAKLDGAGNYVWSQSFWATGGGQYVGGWAVDTDASGNILVAGLFNGTIDLGGGPLVTAGEYDLFLAKLDPSGNHIWSKRFGDAGDQCFGAGCGVTVAVDATDAVLVAVSVAGTLDFGTGPLPSAGGADIFVARFDAAGVPVWAQRSGSTGNDGVGIRIDAADQIWLAGYFEGSVDLHGAPIVSNGQTDGFVARIDGDGAVQWTKVIGGAGIERVLGMLPKAGGEVVLAGHFDGGFDIDGTPLSTTAALGAFVAELDASGSHSWSVAFGSAGNQSASASVIDSANRIIVSGIFETSFELPAPPVAAAGDNDTFVAALGGNGSVIAARAFGGPGFDGIGAFASAADGVLFAGVFENTVDFGSAILTSSGGLDIVLGKWSPMP